MTAGDDSLREVLARHRAFWQCGEVDRPLTGKVRMPRNPLDDYDWGFPEGQGSLEPHMLAVDHFLPQVESYFQAGGILDDDLFWPVVPTRSIPWLEAMMGASVRYSNDHGAVSIFAEAVIDDWNHLPAVAPLPENPWFRKLIEFVEGLAALSAGRFPLAGSHTRGPWDIISALRGMTNVFDELYTQPDPLNRLAERCADLWIEVTSRLAAIVPPWEGGHVGVFGVWAPAFSAMPQNDMSISVSPRMYVEIMAPSDLRTIQACEFPMFHLHSAGAHHVEAVLNSLASRGSLSIVMDDSGPAIETLLPLLRKVQNRKVPLHLFAPQKKVIEELASRLSPRGLALTYSE